MLRVACALVALPLVAAVPVASAENALHPVGGVSPANQTELFFSWFKKSPPPPPGMGSPPPPPGQWWDWSSPITSIKNGVTGAVTSAGTKAAAAIFDTMAPDIKVYSTLPPTASLQADLTTYEKDIVLSEAEETRAVNATNKATVDVNFPIAVNQISRFGAWWGNTIRESYTNPMSYLEQVAYAGQPSSALPLVEVSHVKVMEADFASDHLHLAYATGHGSLVTDGIYDWFLERKADSVYCRHIKQGKPNPNLWKLTSPLLNPTSLKANNDAAVITMCDDILDVIFTGKTTVAGVTSQGYPNKMWEQTKFTVAP